MRRALCRLSIGFTLAALVTALPSAVQAQTSGSAVIGGSPPEATLSVTVRASVGASCAFVVGNAPAGTYSVGDVEGAYSIDVPFSLRCNSPSRVGVVSDNGGLLAAGIPAVPTGYARLAPYQITLRLAGLLGSTAQETCQSPTLTASASGCTFRGPATSTRGLRLPAPSLGTAGSFLRISSPGYSEPGILIASDAYADRLTVTISPAT
jgi:hypothetical protein